jgi:DNA-binding MarR family transcriptional regulator
MLVSLRTIMFHQAVADQLGLHLTDHKCLLLLFEQPQTAGYLADATGLTTGAITAAIDRLERAGYVTRTVDPHDRRRVIIQAIPERLHDVAALFAPLGQAVAALEATYTQHELEIIHDYNQKTADLLIEETLKIKQTGK